MITFSFITLPAAATDNLEDSFFCKSYQKLRLHENRMKIRKHGGLFLQKLIRVFMRILVYLSRMFYLVGNKILMLFLHEIFL